MAYGEASSSKNRAHRPGGDGESSPGGGRSILLGPWGGIIFQIPGTPAWGDGESSPGGGRNIRQGPWGGIISQKPGTPAWGGRGVQPRGWSEYPSGPMGRHYLPNTGHTGLGGTGGPAQGVVGVSFRAHGEASSSKNRAHQPGEDGKSSPGGGRSILQGWAVCPVGPVGRQSSRCFWPTSLGEWGAPLGGRAVTGGRHQGGCFQRCARLLGGRWTAPCRWPLLCALSGYPFPLRRRAAPPAGPRAGFSGRKAVLTPRLSKSCDGVAPHP